MKKAALSAFCILTLSALSALSGHAELVTDGSFSGGFTSWTIPAGANSGDPYYMSTSSLGAQIGTDTFNPQPGSVSQVLATTPGQQYTITFLYGEYNSNPSSSVNNPVECGQQSGCYLDLANITSSHDPTTDVWAQSNFLNVLVGGSDVLDLSNFFTSDPANTGPNNIDDGLSIGDYFYQEATVNVVATGTSTTLEFDAQDHQQAVLLTDVSVTATPEPGTFILFGGGAALVAFFRMRNRKAILQ